MDAKTERPLYLFILFFDFAETQKHYWIPLTKNNGFYFALNLIEKLFPLFIFAMHQFSDYASFDFVKIGFLFLTLILLLTKLGERIQIRHMHHIIFQFDSILQSSGDFHFSFYNFTYRYTDIFKLSSFDEKIL